MPPFDTIGLQVTPRMMLDHHALGYVYDTEPMVARLHHGTHTSAVG